MDAQELRNLQEAYLGVYIQEEVDLWVSDIIEEGYDIDEYTDEELLEAFLDERKNEDPKGVANKAGVNKPDAWGAPTKFGQEATRNSLAAGMKGVRTLQRAGVRINRHHRNKYLAYKVHQGWSKAAKESEHQTPEQKERRSKLIKPDLATFRRDLPKHERDKDVPFVRKAERAVNKQGEFAESYDIYDIILSHLLDEGYAETPEAAEVIMVNMSEEWREDIVEELTGERAERAKKMLQGLNPNSPKARALERILNSREGQLVQRIDRKTGEVTMSTTIKGPTKRGGGGIKGKIKHPMDTHGSGNRNRRRRGIEVTDTSGDT